MFKAYNKVRMHDTDMAGILYFPRQFRFVHDALEDLLESEGTNFQQIFRQEEFVFVIVHAEADYLTPLVVGDKLEIHITVERIGSSSFTFLYKIFKEDGTLSGMAKTIHVSLQSDSRKKIPIPAKLASMLKKHLDTNLG